jgi:predicted DNA-binding transcriptional regulator
VTRRNNVVHKGGRGLYSAVPKELARDGSLSAAARSVALYVWSHDQKWQQSRNDIAEALRISVHTATKALRELEERGWMVRNAVERTWYLQISNTPFTDDEIRKYSGRLEQKLLQSEGTRAETAPPTGAETAPPTRAIFAPHRSTSRSAPEVHDCRSTDEKGTHTVVRPERADRRGADRARHQGILSGQRQRTDQDETGSQGRSLAVEGSEAPGGADGRGLEGPSQSEPASAGSSAEPKARLSGPDSDPWGGSASEPATAAVGVEDWSQYEPGEDRDMSPKAQRIRAHVPIWRRTD